jgi:uncharacterized protein YegL
VDDPWRVVGVERSATLKEARKAYLLRLQLVHPDRHAGSSPDILAAAEEATRDLNEAWEVIERHCNGIYAPERIRTEVLGAASPVYVVAEESLRMGPTIDELNNGLHSLMEIFAGKWHNAIDVRLSLVGLSGRTRWLLKNVRLESLGHIPPLVEFSGVSYDTVFRELHTRIDSDINLLRSEGYGVHRPMVFLVVGSSPEQGGSWEEAVKALTSESFGRHPVLVCYGLANASVDGLRVLGKYCDLTCAQIGSTSARAAAYNCFAAIARSVRDSVGAILDGRDEVELTVPTNFRVVQR